LVYKKYINRDGKKFGPYYFKSVREKDGRVRSVYLGTEDPSKKRLSFFGIFFLVALLFLTGFLGMFAYQGFQVAEISEVLEDSEEVFDSLEKDFSDDQIVEEVDREEVVEEIEEPTEEVIIKEAQETIDEEINETEEELEEDVEINETEITVEVNDSIKINETETDLDETENESLNITEEENQTEVITGEGSTIDETNRTEIDLNEIINESLNITEEENQTFLSLDNESYEFTLNHSGVVINQPIKWEKKVKLKEKKEIYNIGLPEDAFDVEFYEPEEEIPIGEIPTEQGEDIGNLITGNAVFNFFKNIFRFTGKVTYKINKENIVIRAPPNEFLIKYSTPGPTSKEIELNQYSKKIIINGKNFEDVLANTYLNDSFSGGVNLYLLKGEKREKWNFKSEDLDADGYIDYIEWNIPNLADTEVFEIEIIILNVQSFPVVGGNWTVRFNTTGTADLKIKTINETTWDLINNGENDLEFLDVMCGEESLEYLWVNESVFVADYSCNETGSEASKVLTSGKHHLEFDFGGQKGYANNLAISCGDTISTGGSIVVENDITGCTAHGVTLNADNMVFDCDGHIIGGDNVDGSEYGILISNQKNVTVKNCNILNFSRGGYEQGSNNTWTNNNISQVYDFGIYTTGSTDYNMTGNDIGNFKATGNRRGLYFNLATGGVIYDNIIHDITGGPCIRHDSSTNYMTGTKIYNNTLTGCNDGLFISYSFDILFENNSIYDNARYGSYFYNNNGNLTFSNNDVYTTDASQDMGFYFRHIFQNSTIRNNRISNHTANAGVYLSGADIQFNNMANNTLFGNKYNLYLSNASNNIFSYNKVVNSTYWGILIWNEANNNSFYSDEVYNTFYDGVYIYTNSDNNTLDNMSIHNNSRAGSSWYNLYFRRNTDGNIVKNSVIKNSHGRGVFFNDDTGTIENTLFINSVIDEPVASVDIRFDPGAGEVVTFLNSTTTGLTYVSGTLERQWYLDVHTNVSDGSDLENANVSIYNVSDILIFDGLTDATGNIVRQNLTESFQTGASTYSYMTNYTVNASHGDYGFLNESVNLTTNMVTTITFSVDNGPPDNPTPSINSTDGSNQTSQDLNCVGTITDPDSDAMNVTIRWYNNTILWLTDSYDNDYDSGTVFNATLGNLNTTKSETWYCSIQLTDGELTSNWVNSTNLTIKNTPPTQFTNIVLNSSSGLNRTAENLTLYFDDGSDNDGDDIHNITDWRKNGISLAVLNMPFDSNVNTANATIRDYTTFENNGTLGNITTTTQPVHNSTSCRKGGCYHFDGDDDHIQLGNSFDIFSGVGGTVMGWMKFDDLDSDHQLIGLALPGQETFSLWMDENGENDRFGIAVYNDTSSSWLVEYGTVNPDNTSWWHVTFRYVENGSRKDYIQLYVNGVQDGPNLYASTTSKDVNWRIGIGDNDLKQHKGLIDEVKIFNFSLTPEQIYREYLDGFNNHSTRTIVSNETTKGDNWTVAVTPNDLVEDGEVVSSSLIVENSPPDQVPLGSPEAGNTTIDRTPTLTWLAAIDDDGDNLSYNLVVDNDEGFTSPAIEIQTGVRTYTPAADLDLDVMYYWKVNATDGVNVSEFSEVWNFTVNSYVSVSLINNTADFGSMVRSTTDNTTDDSPYPFVVENDGNSLINISVNATSLFDSVAMGSSNYQFRIDNHSEAGSFNWTTSITSWTNLLTSQVVAIDALKYDDASDTAQCEILIDVPSDEISGGKSSSILFEASLAE